MGYKFLGDADKEQELNAQVIEAMVAWREARRDYDKAQSEWAEVRETARGDELYQKLQRYEQIRDGTLARLELLADEL
jgi:hypothetical protein